MKFSEIEYIQIDFEDIKVKFEELILELKKSKNKQEALNVIKKINELNVEFDTYYSIASIRNSIDTSDELYSKAQEYFDEVSPKFQELSTNYYKVLINLPFKDELKDELGALLFDRIDLSLKTFSPEIIEDVIEVNKLSTEYSKLLASAKIEFGTYNGALSNFLIIVERNPIFSTIPSIGNSVLSSLTISPTLNLCSEIIATPEIIFLNIS